jgi:hypothetical protein
LLISLASSSSPLLASIVDFIGLKPIAIVNLHCQFQWSQAYHHHQPQSLTSLDSSPLPSSTSIVNSIKYGLFVASNLLDYCAANPSQVMLYLNLPFSIEATGFIPQDFIKICVGTVTAKVYPKILPAMAVFGHAHAFQVNKTALTNLQANLHLVFDAFGGQLNTTSTVDNVYSDWKRFFNEHWHNSNNLTILSFHNSAGNQIRDTTLTGNPQVLLPIHDGNLVNCHSQDVCFVCVKCTLDFTSRQHMVCNPTPLILYVSYYFELP